MAFNDLLCKSEAALKSVVDALELTGTRGGESVDVTVTTGLDADTLQIPAVVCAVENTAEEAVIDTGVFRVPAKLKIISNADEETLATHRARVGSVADSVYTDDIATTLSAAVSDYHVFAVYFEGLSESADGRAFETDVNLRLVCCCRDIS